MEIKKDIEEIVNTVGGDLQKLAKEYGAWIVIALIVVYVWRKIK